MADVHEVQEANNKPNRKAKSFFTFNVKQPMYLRKKVTEYPGIYFCRYLLFTNRVITHFGSNFLKISCDY